MGSDEGFLALDGDLPEIGQDEGALIDHFVEGLSGEELHDDVGAVFVHPGVIDGDDVGVLDGGEGGGFLQEVLGGLFLVFEAAFGEDAFDGDIAVKAFVPGFVDGADAALADFFFNLVAVVFHALGEAVSCLLASGAQCRKCS